MPGQFIQSYWVRLEMAGSGDDVQEGDVEPTPCAQGWVFSDVFAGELGAAVVWSGPEGFALLAKVAKSVGMASYDSLSSVNTAVGALKFMLHPLLLQ